MAANEYYHSPYTTAYHDQTPPYSYSSRKNDALPPPPSHSPFHDQAYPYGNPSASHSYTGSHGRLNNDSDPFEDDDAVPMHGRRPKHDSAATVAPILPHEVEDPFVRDVDPGRPKGRRTRDGWFKGKVPWVVYTLTVIQLVVFIAEIARNAVLTKSPIEIHPSFNVMIGPSPYVMINMGARYQPCMHNMANVQNSSTEISWPCPNATSTTGASVSCTLSELCGGSGVPNPHVGGSIDEKPAPNQWWRFIVPIFLHAGIVHIGFNLLLQMTLGKDVERLIGSVRFFILYFAAGIFGFVLGGNFAATGIASTGCSGSLFGILAITLLDLLYTWKERRSPGKDLLFIVLDMIVAFVLGLLPGLDNFSHIGGFLMGLVLGVCLLRSPAAIARRTSQDAQYAGMPPRAYNDEPLGHGLKAFAKSPLTFFQNRRGAWWAFWVVRVVALVGCLVCTILLFKNFYQWRKTCAWCKYLSCLPITVSGTNWCNVGNLEFTSTTSSSKRALEAVFAAALGDDFAVR